MSLENNKDFVTLVYALFKLSIKFNIECLMTKLFSLLQIRFVKEQHQNQFYKKMF